MRANARFYQPQTLLFQQWAVILAIVSSFASFRSLLRSSTRFAVLVVSLCSAVICHSSFAEPLSIELVSEVTSIQPGMPFYVGLHLKHQEHYHTYWRFPGIVGVPTSMA